jgi:predicted phage terminase large subunit-like protein
VKPGWQLTKFHRYLCEQLQDLYESVIAGGDVNYIVECQPQVGKSVLCSELFPAWVLGMSPLDGLLECPVIVASYGSSLAEVKSANCRSIVSSDPYAMIFPKTALNPETSAKDFWKTTTGGSYRAAGVGTGLTGQPGKFLLADDLLKDAEDAKSETVRDSTWRWWQTVFLSRRQDVSSVVLVNTRWDTRDVAGLVEEQYRSDLLSGKPSHEYDHWKQFTFPAFALEDEYLDGVLFRKAGAVLCPERFSFETMVRKRNSMDVYLWSALFMQQPILKENASFRAEWFRYYDADDVKLKDLNWYIFIDPAASKRKGADNTVIRAVGKERTTGFWFLGDEIAGQLDPGATVDALFVMARQYPGATAWIESVAYQRTLEYWVVEKQRRDQFFFRVELLERKHVQGKEVRIEGLIPLYKAGQIFHRPGADKDYESELLAFPMGKHDDRVDAVSFALDVVPNTITGETPRQVKARERAEKESFDPHSAFTHV